VPNKSIAPYQLPERRIYDTMKQRCYNRRHDHYDRYGGRGIVVCERWRKSFAAFLMDMGRRPTPQHTIDRIDNDGDYEPSNCRWATKKQNCRNRKTSHTITVDGVTRTLVEWSEITGINRHTIAQRIANGLDPKKAVSIRPMRTRRKGLYV